MESAVNRALRTLGLAWLLLLLPALLLLSRVEARPSGPSWKLGRQKAPLDSVDPNFVLNADHSPRLTRWTVVQRERFAQQQAPLDYQLLTNPGVETYDPPYGQFDGIDCQVASGWQRFWYGGPEPCWMDTRVFASSHLGGGWVERIEGDTSQLLLATEPYSAGIYQQVTGLTPGVGYGFHAAMLTIFQTSAQEPVHGTMIKDVGMDPTGGTDPQAPTVVWSEADPHDQGPWSIDIRTAAYAQSPTMTVFIRVRSLYPSGGLPFLNLSFLDSAILAETAVVTASAPAFSESPTFTVRWDDVRPSPQGTVRWFDVQWLDEGEGVWHDWFTRTADREATFSGQRGHTYRFRARAWQRYPNNAHLYGPYRPQGDARTYVRGPRLVGQVLTAEGVPLAGAAVAISGTAYVAESGPGGRYLLDLEPLTGSQTITVSHPFWLSPPPVQGVTFGLTETVALTWTLRPPGDAVVNGGFEGDLAGWTLQGEMGERPAVVTAPVHSGLGAVRLGSGAATSRTLGLSQTVRLTHAWEPALSFWYLPTAAAPGDQLRVTVALVSPTVQATPTVMLTRIYTPSLGVGEWTHLWYSPGFQDRWLTGTLTLGFWLLRQGSVTTTTVYLDEVSVGATPGGPYKVYLPLVLRTAAPPSTFRTVRQSGPGAR